MSWLGHGAQVTAPGLKRGMLTLQAMEKVRLGSSSGFTQCLWAWGFWQFDILEMPLSAWLGHICPRWGANARGKVGQRKVTNPAQHLPGGDLLPSRNGLAQSNVIFGGWWPQPSSSVAHLWGQQDRKPNSLSFGELCAP